MRSVIDEMKYRHSFSESEVEKPHKVNMQNLTGEIEAVGLEKKHRPASTS